MRLMQYNQASAPLPDHRALVNCSGFYRPHTPSSQRWWLCYAVASYMLW